MMSNEWNSKSDEEKAEEEAERKKILVEMQEEAQKALVEKVSSILGLVDMYKPFAEQGLGKIDEVVQLLEPYLERLRIYSVNQRIATFNQYLSSDVVESRQEAMILTIAGINSMRNTTDELTKNLNNLNKK